MTQSRKQALDALKRSADETSMTLITEEDGTIRYSTGSVLGRLGIVEERVNGDIMRGIKTAIHNGSSFIGNVMSHEATFNPTDGEFVVVSFRPIFPSHWSPEEYYHAIEALQMVEDRCQEAERNHAAGTEW